ncbi:hypothetical protein H4Q26_003521 [Puccinia striiformis f. sp. tritici PST-130]|nr:hypothetical protein H4Q26_003521 [Puccinia striiformis f. sp. tritici PST-130]
MKTALKAPLLEGLHPETKGSYPFIEAGMTVGHHKANGIQQAANRILDSFLEEKDLETIVRPELSQGLKTAWDTSLFYFRTWWMGNHAHFAASHPEQLKMDEELTAGLPEDFLEGLEKIRSICARIFKDDEQNPATDTVREVRNKAWWFEMSFASVFPDHLLTELTMVDPHPALEWHNIIRDLHLRMDKLQAHSPEIKDYISLVYEPDTPPLPGLEILEAEPDSPPPARLTARLQSVITPAIAWSILHTATTSLSSPVPAAPPPIPIPTPTTTTTTTTTPQHFHQQQQNQNPFNRLQPNPLLFRQQPNQLFNQIQPRPPPPTFHPNLVQPLPPKFRLPPQNQPRTLPNPIQVSLTQSNLLSLPQRTPIGQTPPPSQQQQPSPQKKRLRSRTQRVPLKLSINQLNSACPYNQPEQRSLDSFTSRLEYSDKPLDNSLPDSIDVYLPGREVWDEFRIEILSDKLSELGYPTHIAPNSTTHSNIGEDEDDDEEEQDLRQRLDLRERLQAFLQENPEATFHIPSITGVFPFPTLTQPVLLPISSPSSPPGSPLLKPATPVETPENQPTSSSSTIVSATAAPFIISLSSSGSTFAQTHAAEFKPSLATHPFSSIWGPPLPASELPPTPSLFQPAGSLNPYPMSTPSTPLDVVGEEDENDIITDSDPDEQEGQLNSDLDQLDNEHSALGDRPLSAQEEDDDIPLARLQHSLQRHIIDPTHEALPRCYVSAADTDPGESAYDGDSDRQSDCTNPSDEDEVDHQNPEMLALSSLSTPNTRIGRSHTFGFSRLSSSRKSMSAGEGYPHNWINGYEEEEDMVSNPSDEEEAQLHQSQSAVNNTSSSEITSPAKQSPTASTFKNTTNLAITVGRATGNVMSTGLSPIKKPLSTTSLNAFAVEFKPSFASATPLLRYPSITFSDNLETPGPNKLQFTSTLVKTQAATQAEVTKTSNETEDTPGSAVFATLKELESAPPSPCAPKSTDELSEQPGKDNMRDFKFPATPTSRMIFYQTQMSRSTSSSAIVSPILALDQAVDFKHPSDALPLGNAPQLASSDSVPMIASGSSSLHPQILYPSPVFDSPANEKPSVSGTAPSIVLRQRSSFDDDSGSENSQSAPRHLSDGKVGSPDFYRLIPTQPRSKSPGRREASSEQDGEADEDDYDFDVGEGEDEVELRSHKSHNSLVSLRQLQEQKRQWERLSSTGLNRDGNCNRSDYDDDRNSSGSNRHNPSTESIRVLLEVDTTARKRHSKPPQVNVPPGSPFSPFEGSFDEDPPTLRLRPLTPHAILPPSLPDCWHSNLARKTSPRASKATPVVPRVLLVINRKKNSRASQISQSVIEA